MKYIDIGLNLMHKSYNKDREEVIKNAQNVGVTNAIITGADIQSSIEAAEYSEKYPTRIPSGSPRTDP